MMLTAFARYPLFRMLIRGLPFDAYTGAVEARAVAASWSTGSDHDALPNTARIARICLFLLLALGWPGAGSGKSGDTELPVHVQADTAELNQTTGVGVYRGEVRITQGSMVLTADKVTVIAPARNLRRVIARSDDKGDKAHFRQITDTGDVLTAEARHMTYVPDKSRITLLEDAVLNRGANHFAAERIVYRIVQQVVDAGGGADGGRVKMTLVQEARGERSSRD